MQPEISVGILSAEKINFSFNDNYFFEGKNYNDTQSVHFEAGKIRFAGKSYQEIIFEPTTETANFDLHEVVIGIGFHWERRETQRFTGKLKIIVENKQLTAVNILPLEDYLLSVISSEMSATSSLELLKAHAVTSRSWLLAQLKNVKMWKCGNVKIKFQISKLFSNFHIFKFPHSPIIKWYDKDDHANFDVCADDHCQRYQGITRATSEAVRQAVEATRGEGLTYGGEVCDARFSKCCGGITERFESCWQPEAHGYLVPVEDSMQSVMSSAAETSQKRAVFLRCLDKLDMTNFIKTSNPNHFCNTTNARILRQVLNSYDQETADFYRWQVSYTQAEIAGLLRRRSGIDFGEIVDLQPVERGASGRLVRLKIVGTKRTVTVGKELEIRRWLSETHLYSSAFVVEKEDFSNGIPQRFTLHGAGWGHGVGLCQIGAAVMAEKGYGYREILLHYFRNTAIELLY